MRELPMLDEWLRDGVDIDPMVCDEPMRLWRAWARDCEGRGMPEHPRWNAVKTLSQSLRRAGYEYRRHKGRRVFVGLRAREAAPVASDSNVASDSQAVL